jgi:hypothetical protein
VKANGAFLNPEDLFNQSLETNIWFSTYSIPGLWIKRVSRGLRRRILRSFLSKCKPIGFSQDWSFLFWNPWNEISDVNEFDEAFQSLRYTSQNLTNWPAPSQRNGKFTVNC